MTTVGIRALQQHASAVVAQVEGGDTVVVTDRGRPVALITPIGASPLAALVASGRARPPRHSFADVPAPRRGPSLSSELAAMRDDERY